MSTVSFFDGVSHCSPAFTEKLGTLLTWSITPLQFGDHRIYVAATLLRFWRDKFEERAIRRDTSSADNFIQDQLFDWLDRNDVAGDDINLSNIACLFGKLVKDGLFQYALYVQRLVARGEPGISFTEVRRLFITYRKSSCLLSLQDHGIGNSFGASRSTTRPRHS